MLLKQASPRVQTPSLEQSKVQIFDRTFAPTPPYHLPLLLVLRIIDTYDNDSVKMSGQGGMGYGVVVRG